MRRRSLLRTSNGRCGPSVSRWTEFRLFRPRRLRPTPQKAPLLSDKPSIAVLPFQNMSRFKSLFVIAAAAHSPTRAALSRHLPAPAQRVLDLDREVARRLPPQLAFGLRDIADQTRQVAGPARADAVRHGAAGNASGLGHRLANAVAGAATDVEGPCTPCPGCFLSQPSARTWASARSVTWT